MNEKLLGKCGFYCGACPTYIKGDCCGCEEEHTMGDCFTRDCVEEEKREERIMELWDLYNENRELTGKTHIRGQEVPQGFYHLVVHVWIRNSNGEYLLSQRSADRPTFPLMWECVGGSAVSGEDSLTAALRETKEEVGLDLSADNGKLAYSVIGRVINGLKYTDIVDAWLFEYDGDINLNDATTAEVAQTKWMSCEEIRADIKIERLLMVGENFFPWGSRPCHQINLYYLVSLTDEAQIPLDGSFKAVDELGNERINLDMCWIPMKDIPNITVYPTEAKEHIINIPNEIVHFVYKE